MGGAAAWIMRTMSTRGTSADSARCDNGAQQRAVIGPSPPIRSVVTKPVPPGCGKWGHPAHVTNGRRDDAALWLLPLMFTWITRTPSTNHFGIEIQPPRTTEHSGCAWEIVGALEAWWEVKTIE